MYHYQKNIGDYRSATMHLSLLEHGVYNQLLDWYYLDEQPLSIDNRTLFRRLSARSEIEQQAVLDVLSEMFVQTDAGWVHKRVEREITLYRAKAEQARAAGKLGGRPRKTDSGSTENRDGFEKEADAKPTANREPVTNNQEPKDIGSASAELPTKTVTARMLTAEGVDKQSADDWLTLRKAKRLPLTPTAWQDTKAEGEKVGLCPAETVAHAVRSNWAGFKASWYTRDAASAANNSSASVFAGVI